MHIRAYKLSGKRLHLCFDWSLCRFVVSMIHGHVVVVKRNKYEQSGQPLLPFARIENTHSMSFHQLSEERESDYVA